MNYKYQKASPARLLFLLAALLSINCNVWTPLPPETVQPALLPTQARAPSGAAMLVQPAQPTDLPEAEPENTVGPVVMPVVGAGEPAGCLALQDQSSLQNVDAMLRYADSLLGFSSPLAERRLPDTYNAYTGEFSYDPDAVLSLSVEDVENAFLVQQMMNALHVAGFVTWLRRTYDQGLHILAIPLRDPSQHESVLSPYIEAYWLSSTALPSGDPQVLHALKLPPCAWMVEQGLAPQVDSSWWAQQQTGWPEYAAAAEAYLAGTNEESSRVANQIDWLGEAFPEGPDTMCGPLAWSILNDAGAFPPGYGAWAQGAKVFWLSKPEENGRPWSLFPKDTYVLKRVSSPLGTYDFRNFPLYPGDFFYTYSARDGFDHMFVVTETDGEGNVYTVSNIVRVDPEKRTTIERVLLLNIHDPFVGIARNDWAHDKVNGRTGHAGFEVFRWAWMEKDISGQPASYRVMPGDTYGLIAARWKTPASQIAEYNGDTMDSPLMVGQTIIIPPNVRDGRQVGFER